MFWFDKSNKNVLFVDNRYESHKLCDGQTIHIHPDIVADFRCLPFADYTFKMVVFDPPHLIQAGENGWQKKKYGSLDNIGWKEYIKDGFEECYRVLDIYGTLIFKWNETDIPLSKILDVIKIQPLFGHKSGKKSNTHWMCFMKLRSICI